LITIEHNGKKKTSAIAYKPLVDTSNIPAVVETQKINEIPPYEDKGVRYQGKYKEQTGNFDFTLRRQEENSIQIVLNGNLAGLPFGHYPIVTDHPLQNFVFDKISIHYINSHTKTGIVLNDSGGNGIEFSLPSTGPGGSDLSTCFNFDIVPKTFVGDFDLFLDHTINANEFIAINLWGWYEDK